MGAKHITCISAPRPRKDPLRVVVPQPHSTDEVKARNLCKATAGKGWSERRPLRARREPLIRHWERLPLPSADGSTTGLQAEGASTLLS